MTASDGPGAAAPAMSARPGLRDYGLLLLLGATWGSSFLLIKLAVATIPPVTVAAGRIAVGAAALGIVVALRRPAISIGADAWPKLAAMALLGYVVPFALIGWGETHIDSGLTARRAADDR
jgi:drug/metabolite transporter (DMT)-like permease